MSLNKIDIESCYVFEMKWNWVLLCIWIRLTLSVVMYLNKIDIESCYVFEMKWNWVLLCLLYCLHQGPKTIGLSQKPLPSLLVNKLLVLFFWHPKQILGEKYNSNIQPKWFTKMRFIYNQNDLHWVIYNQNDLHRVIYNQNIDSYTTKMRFIYNQNDLHWVIYNHCKMTPRSHMPKVLRAHFAMIFRRSSTSSNPNHCSLPYNWRCHQQKQKQMLKFKSHKYLQIDRTQILE